ncbi:Ig-like domain-containing protein [Methanothermobacter sp.]|uniref:Ig-like domain-containing protein n=1 Tax=Methanothermobacter sp. TaxID=1884223 RepID=UPI002621D711|nr:Ig-like domain-containing protein [Methanothermobacter sp.]MDI9617471.1 Ig-like domain-containing protein [Methanothermobacter sp.]
MTTRRPIISVTFSSQIKPGRYWKSITLRDQLGKTVRIKKWVSGNTLNVKPLSRLSGNRWYTLVVPAAALVDSPPPHKMWTLKFRTGEGEDTLKIHLLNSFLDPFLIP